MASESKGHSSSHSETNKSTNGSRSSNGARPESAAIQGSICTFWLGERRLGLDTALVGEVVTVEEAIRIPLAPPAVRGVFNLRGQPVPLVSLGAILGSSAVPAKASKAITAMVLRSDDLVVGLVIDRVEAVVPPGRGTISRPTSAEEDASILGFLEITTDGKTSVVEVMDPAALLERLSGLRFLRGEAA